MPSEAPDRKPCAKRCFSDPLAAARFMQAMYLTGKNSKGGKPGVYYCDYHQAYHWGHSRLPWAKTNQIERVSR